MDTKTKPEKSGYNSIFVQWKPYGFFSEGEQKHSFRVSQRKTTLGQVDLTDFIFSVLLSLIFILYWSIFD